ncbi:MAG: hypothetical protein Q9227_000066 [Pyrenula ochraceoflavens]
MDMADITTLFGRAIGDFEQISNHVGGSAMLSSQLRAKGSAEDANEISRLTLALVKTFNGATADWDIEKCLMEDIERPLPTTPLSRADSTASTNRHGIKVGSWAAVAATSTPKSNAIVKHHTDAGAKRTAAVPFEERPVSAHELRVVWVQFFGARKSLSEITKEIQEGPLLSVAYSQADSAVCIIFQHSANARAFLCRNQEFQDRRGRSLYGPNVQLLEGQAYPYDNDLRRMESPANERRRLTFARSKLFCPVECGVSEQAFTQHIYDIVGSENVELVWLFNTGNATVVFTATSIARLVRDEFRRYAMTRGNAYWDLQVSFSHDPCERPLNLISQMNGLASTGRPNVPQRRISNPFAGRMGPPPVSPRRQNISADKDGWQTVITKRR